MLQIRLRKIIRFNHPIWCIFYRLPYLFKPSYFFLKQNFTHYFQRFYSPGCQACVNSERYWIEASQQSQPGITYANIDGRANRKIVKKYGMKRSPTFYLFKDGYPQAEYSGERNTEGFAKFAFKMSQAPVIEHNLNLMYNNISSFKFPSSFKTIDGYELKDLIIKPETIATENSSLQFHTNFLLITNTQSTNTNKEESSLIEHFKTVARQFHSTNVLFHIINIIQLQESSQYDNEQVQSLNNLIQKQVNFCPTTEQDKNKEDFSAKQLIENKDSLLLLCSHNDGEYIEAFPIRSYKQYEQIINQQQSIINDTKQDKSISIVQNWIQDRLHAPGEWLTTSAFTYLHETHKTAVVLALDPTINENEEIIDDNNVNIKNNNGTNYSEKQNAIEVEDSYNYPFNMNELASDYVKYARNYHCQATFNPYSINNNNINDNKYNRNFFFALVNAAQNKYFDTFFGVDTTHIKSEINNETINQISDANIDENQTKQQTINNNSNKKKKKRQLLPIFFAHNMETMTTWTDNGHYYGPNIDNKINKKEQTKEINTRQQKKAEKSNKRPDLWVDNYTLNEYHIDNNNINEQIKEIEHKSKQLTPFDAQKAEFFLQSVSKSLTARKDELLHFSRWTRMKSRVFNETEIFYHEVRMTFFDQAAQIMRSSPISASSVVAMVLFVVIAFLVLLISQCAQWCCPQVPKEVDDVDDDENEEQNEEDESKLKEKKNDDKQIEKKEENQKQEPQKPEKKEVDKKPKKKVTLKDKDKEKNE
ncbi:MAG: hypothetical protein EZS28_002849 [Streblomastix strix]|uniref:Thioredoxin domain-containing protein n=1 Tax=Streblomastix strix TaxID=222440 RepID=A0A5J4X4M7_9EUKA|nr:MAG: hypothetical protein EZS28_002849 [Streblomastix strix]